MRGGDLDRLLGGAGFADNVDVVDPGQQGPDPFAEDGVVVDHHDPDRGHDWHRDPGGQHSAAAGGRSNFEGTAEGFDPAAHRGDAQAADVGLADPDSVVGHQQRQPAVHHSERHVGVAGVGVPDHVGDRLQGDPVDGQLDGRREGPVVEVVQVDGEAWDLRPGEGGDVVADQAGQAGVVGSGRLQVVGDPADLGGGVAEPGGEPGGLLGVR